MPRDYLSEFLPDLEEFREKTLKFHRKEMSVAEYKGFSGGFGSYAERGGETHMLRLRMAGGQITKERLQFIVGICDKYHVERLKLTTCQSIQLHHLRAEDLYDMMAAAWKAGMISRGGGGDFPRNVLASPLSGVQRDEYFDVLPYAQAAGDYMMGFIKAVKFPRKLKVGFSNSPANETHVTFRDLGFAATPEGTFDVYAAGGLGINPKLGVCVAKGIDPGKILYYIKAMVNTFTTYGNYENRARARTRYLQDTLGEKGLVKAYQEKLEEVSATEQLDVDIAVPVLSKTGPEAAVEDKRIIPQKQKGLYAVFYQPLGGSLTPAKAEELYHLIEDMEDVEIRLTPDEGLYVINCSAGEAERVLQRTERIRYLRPPLPASAILSARWGFGIPRLYCGTAWRRSGRKTSRTAFFRRFIFPAALPPAARIRLLASACGVPSNRRRTARNRPLPSLSADVTAGEKRFWLKPENPLP